MIGFCTAFAHASTPVWLLRAKAGIAAAMFASNLFINPINAVLDDTLLEGIDPIGYVETISDTPWTEYIDQSTIVVRPDVAVIDGVPYSEVWIGPDAANSLRLTGLDFASAYNIISNQSQAITYADGLGYVSGIPVYEVNGYLKSQPFVTDNSAGSYSLGDFTLTKTDEGARYYFTGRFYLPDGTMNWQGNISKEMSLTSQIGSNALPATQIRFDNSYPNGATIASFGIPLSYFEPESFSFDYVSGDIYVEPDPEDGLLLTVPSSYDDGQSGSVFNYDIHDLINIYPQVDDTYGHDLVFDPSLNPDFQVDIDMGNALGDIITAVILAKLADLLGDNSEIVYAPMPEKDDPGPQPGVIDPLPDPDPAPDDPVPGTTIANTDWTKLDEILRWIQSTIDSIRHLTESLQTMLDSIFDAIQSIAESIRELADKILEDIELGPAKLFDKAIDILKTLFLPLLLPIRAMMNLWHYVVEWIQSVSSPFTWIFGIMSGTSGNMVLPIYALLAGGICISIYKALGR